MNKLVAYETALDRAIGTLLLALGMIVAVAIAGLALAIYPMFRSKQWVRVRGRSVRGLVCI